LATAPALLYRLRFLAERQARIIGWLLRPLMGATPAAANSRVARSFFGLERQNSQGLAGSILTGSQPFSTHFAKEVALGNSPAASSPNFG